jgi:hypothetical protein
MSGVDWTWPLADGETLLWQGRPAPRCYTFRNWKLSAAGTALFLACSFWMMLGIQLVETSNYSLLLVLITIPLVIATFFLGPGQLLLARWRWEKLFYAVTDQRILVRDGLLTEQFRAFARKEISGWQQRRFGENLVSIRILRGDEAPQILACLEHPQLLLKHLPPPQQGATSAGDSV